MVNWNGLSVIWFASGCAYNPLVLSTKVGKDYYCDRDGGHSCSRGSFRVRDKMKPNSMSPPTREKPRAKEKASPIIPKPLGITPAPTRKAKGMVRETATFLELEGPIQERAAKPAGKKHTANMGCMKTMITIQ